MSYESVQYWPAYNRIAAIELINTVYNKLVFILASTADQYIPTMSPRTLKFWWNGELNELKHSAKISHYRAWIAAGKPTSFWCRPTCRHS